MKITDGSFLIVPSIKITQTLRRPPDVDYLVLPMEKNSSVEWLWILLGDNQQMKGSNFSSSSQRVLV